VTPVGLRTLAPDDPAYQPRYQGDQTSRDRAYHQGTVWPWLIGLYADALHRFEGTAEMRAEVLPILERLRHHLQQEGCMGQIGEVFDAEPPHRPGGTPAQAWSVAEVLRVARMADT
jgi:glycogen debranching enzyme